ncbi:DUF3179 domain-containing protein (plasmid) [Halorientalis pallida]|uniref:DUF3179 domain-containing protein n=1 Tax=Halorientalis pallida TaxID=2479928 RepID=UPI003C6F418C
MNVRDVLPKDAIQSIDEPTFAGTYFGESDDEMVVLDGDPQRAYPLRILSYHEIVNDDVDGEPVAITWCPICWSAVAYRRTVDDRTLTFGVSGKLADDALVMYDRETESEWRQPSGECLAGELEGRSLTTIPTAMMTWREFRETYPDGVVLEPVRGGTGPGERSHSQEYDMEPYHRYREDDDFGLYAMRGEGDRRTWDRTDIDAKTVVLGIEQEDETVGYPLPRVEEAGGVVTDTIGGIDVIVVASDGDLHAFEDPGLGWELVDGTLVGDDATWDPVTGTSEDGRQLRRIPARTLFAFAWQDDHGPEAFYDATDEGEDR